MEHEMRFEKTLRQRGVESVRRKVKPSEAQLRDQALRLTKSLREIPGFVAVGYGADHRGGLLRVLILDAEKKSATRIPDVFEGTPVTVQVSGEIVGFAEE